MAARLPAVTGEQVVRALTKAGFVVERQRGSHVILVHHERKATTVVPIHAGKSLKRPLLRAILSDARLSVDEFGALL